MIWIIAWKNVWRNRLRSLVVVMAIALGLLGGIFSSAVMKGTADQRVMEAIRRELSHLQVHDTAYLQDNDVRFLIGGDRVRMEQTLDTSQVVEAWSPRVKFTAMAASANAGTGVMVMGIDPSREMKVTDLHLLVKDSSGTWFDGYRGVPVVVGEALAKKIKVRLHSKIVLTFQDLHGNLTGAAFRICGIYRTNNSVFDEMNIFVQRSDILPLLGMNDGDCHEIAVKLTGDEHTAAFQQSLQNRFPTLSVRSWKEIDPVVGMLNDFMDLYLYIFLGIILLALGFGIINTMLMAILERTKELGMLAAIGMNRRRIFSLVMLESVFLSLTGGIIGIILGALLTAWTNHTGIDLGSFSQGFEKMGYSAFLYPDLGSIYYLNLTLMVVATGILASVYPARRALKLRPAEAIRND